MTGATVNQTGVFRMRAERVGAESMLMQIVRLVQRAQASKATIARLADRIAAVFVPVVLTVAIVTFVLWFNLGPAPRFAHVPLVLGPDGQRLAKRDGAVTLADRAALGETPTMVLSWMAASLNLAEPGEPVTAAGLVARFDPARAATILPTDPSRLDEHDLASGTRSEP